MTPEEEAAAAGLQAFVDMQDILETTREAFRENLSRQGTTLNQLAALLENSQRASQDAKKATDDLRAIWKRFCLLTALISALAGGLGTWAVSLYRQQQLLRLDQQAQALADRGSLSALATCQIEGFSIMADGHGKPWCTVTDQTGKTVGWPIP